MLAICQAWNPQKLEQDEETCKIMNISKTLQNYVHIQVPFCGVIISWRKHFRIPV